MALRQPRTFFCEALLFNIASTGSWLEYREVRNRTRTRESRVCSFVQRWMCFVWMWSVLLLCWQYVLCVYAWSRFCSESHNAIKREIKNKKINKHKKRKKRTGLCFTVTIVGLLRIGEGWTQRPIQPLSRVLIPGIPQFWAPNVFTLASAARLSICSLSPYHWIAIHVGSVMATFADVDASGNGQWNAGSLYSRVLQVYQPTDLWVCMSK